jgi:hypothetical protein
MSFGEAIAIAILLIVAMNILAFSLLRRAIQAARSRADGDITPSDT